MGVYLRVSLLTFVLVKSRSMLMYTSYRASNKMPAGVRAAIAHAIQEYGGKSEEDAKEYVATMERDGRLIEDCWD